MAQNIVGKIVACLLLVLLCFVIGAQAAESAKSTLMLVVGLVGVVFMLVVGTRSWMLLFLLPPLLEVLPLPGGLKGIGCGFLVACVVLPYWLFMWAMGYVKVRWRGLLALDILFLALLCLMVAAYIKRPVTIQALGLDFDNIGGKVYFIAIGALVYYLAISLIPISYQNACKVLNWRIWVALVCSFIGAGLGLLGFGGGAEATETLGEAMQGSRFGALLPVGMYGSLLIYALYPLSRILCNPALLMGMLVGFACIALSGFRSYMAFHIWVLTFISFVKKEMTMVICIGLLAYGGLLVLSSSGTLLSLPHGIQRTLSAIPGMKVSEDVRRSAEGSSDWRVVMWKWAMDPRTGYIKDYIWGDGFGMSLSGMQRRFRAAMRGEKDNIRRLGQEAFAEDGMWHSGWITAIHRLGIVGMIVVNMFIMYSWLLILRVTISLRGTPLFVPSLVFLMPYTSAPIAFNLSAGTIDSVLSGVATIGLAKLLFCIAREQGLIIPWTQRKRYVPLMIEQHGDQLQQEA